MNSQKPARIKTCTCGKAFTVKARWQRSCEACIEARAAAEAARPPRLCCKCGKEFPRCHRRVCPECAKAQTEAYRARHQADNLDRRRDPVEIYVELCMKKYGPQSDALTSRQQLALDRKIATLSKSLLTGRGHVHHEFYMLVCVVAFRRGILTEECWARMRRMDYHGQRWQSEIRDIYTALGGQPLKECFFYGKRIIELSSDQLEPVLPMLRKLADNPTAAPQEDTAATSQKENRKNESALGLWGALLGLGFGDEDERHGGRYGYGCKLPQPKPEPEIVNPEQVDHADQDTIDAEFYEIMKGAELEI